MGVLLVEPFPRLFVGLIVLLLAESIQPQGGYSRFLVIGMIEWGQESKPKEIPSTSNKPQNILGPTINPQKSHAKFQALIISRKNYMI